MTAIKFFTEEGKLVGTEHFGFGFTTLECINRCEAYAKIEGVCVTAVRPDGFSCGFYAPARAEAESPDYEAARRNPAAQAIVDRLANDLGIE